MRKALFFDIDGTIWDRDNRICDSTYEAMARLKEKGNLIFICSGRTRGYIQNPILLDIGFDGIVSGCGTMLEYKGETIFYRPVEQSVMKRTIETVRKYGFMPILEGPEYIYMDMEEFAGNAYGDKLQRELDNRLASIKDNYMNWNVSKLSCATRREGIEECQKELAEDFDFIIHNERVVEMVPKGFSKGTGILKMCEIAGVEIADTFAFGDSTNDLEMLKTAGHAVVMGNGSEDAKALAEYVTTSVVEDGIYNACVHYGLF